ncbi:hypothetical protein ACR77J_11820 [Tissierella praeacuta]|uniref:hypothetical protein n=1 Tax=Tissierella praeacuta TaxID=43131 RepID=UPI003DA29FFC
MDDKPVIAVIVNPDTGEITDDLHQGDRIVRANSSKSYKKAVKKNSKTDEEFQIWNLDNFYRANISELALWMDDLSHTEKAFLFSVSPYISFEDCRLIYANGVDIGTEDLIKITNQSRSVVYDTINSLIKKDILYKGRNSRTRQYFLNPWLFSKGNRINKVLKGMFGNYKIRILDGKRWKDLK